MEKHNVGPYHNPLLMLQEFYFGWVTVFSKRKGQEKFLRKWTIFFSIGKECLFYIKAQTLRDTIFILLLFPLQNNQALVENCTMRYIIKPAYICKEHCRHQYVFFQTLQLGKACFLTAETGATLRTQRAESEMQTNHSHSSGSAQASQLSSCTFPCHLTIDLSQQWLEKPLCLSGVVHKHCMPSMCPSSTHSVKIYWVLRDPRWWRSGLKLH